MFVGLYRELMEKEPQPQDDLTQLRQNLLAPGGFVDQLAHHPEWRNMHEAVVARSVAWLTHLLALGLVQEAASLANVVVFSLARQGHRRLALGMLAQVISASQGLTRMIAAINLATLHREAGELDTASKLYWQLVPALIRSRAWRPLGAVLSELGVIATYRGHHLQAVLMLEATVELRGWVGDPKGQAISRQQLSTAYRGMGMYGAALKVNCQAETYFRASKDQLNLGRTLMAQGNLMNLSHKPDIALARFEEAGSIGEQIEDPLAAIGSLSGRARAYQQLGELDQARCLLEEAIGRRQRSTAYGHYVGVEYENMGGLYEQQGNLGLALAWYRKALAQFERHQPGETIRCKRKIRTIEARLKKSG
jgi:tetratricopeptide (TPR) repeat protein